MNVELTVVNPLSSIVNPKSTRMIKTMKLERLELGFSSFVSGLYACTSYSVLKI